MIHLIRRIIILLRLVVGDHLVIDEGEEEGITATRYRDDGPLARTTGVCAAAVLSRDDNKQTSSDVYSTVAPQNMSSNGDTTLRRVNRV